MTLEELKKRLTTMIECRQPSVNRKYEIPGLVSMAGYIDRWEFETLTAAQKCLGGDTAHWDIACGSYTPFCSHCGKEPPGREMSRYCPNCGAKMVTRERDDNAAD